MHVRPAGPNTDSRPILKRFLASVRSFVLVLLGRRKIPKSRREIPTPILDIEQVTTGGQSNF
jgi:hypothetical protein